MPIFGELELGTIAEELSRLRDLDTEAWELPKAEILQVSYEIADGSRALLPRALHPAIPEYVTFVVTRYPESPVGPFDLAQVRLMARAGVHPRGYVVGAVASTPSAVSELRARWGYPAAPGEITLRRYHDRVAARVRRGGVARGPDHVDHADLGERLHLGHGPAAHPLRDGPGSPGGPRDPESPLS